jgi:hypothetical protein
MSDDSEKKRSLIQKEILDKKYDINEFEDFLKKETGLEEINMSTWSYENIEKYVKAFQEIQSTSYMTSHSEFINIDYNKKKTVHFEIKEKEKKEKKEKDFVPTKILPRNELTEIQNLNIEITKYSKSKTGIFFSEYILTIEVKELDSKVERSFSDFIWLKKTLETFYPTAYIPPIPKIPFFHKTNDNYLKRKKRYFNKFLICLSQNILIRSTPIFLDFLTSNEEELNNVKETYYNEEPPTSIKKYMTLNGYVNIETGKEKDDYAEKIKNSILKKNNSFIDLNKALKEIIFQFQIFSEKMIQVSNSFSQLANNFNDNIQVKNILNNYKNITQNWSEGYKKQKDIFQIEFKEFFKYIHSFISDFMKFYTEYDNAKYDFMTLYLSYDDINLIKKVEQKELNKLRKKYGFCLNRLISEYDKLNNIILSNNFRNHLEKVNEKRDSLFQDLNNCLRLFDENVGKLELSMEVQ